MNECWAVDPLAGEDVRDWTNLFRCFGPYAGRYIVMFPGKWKQKLRDFAYTLEDGQSKALLRRIELAYQEKKLIESSDVGSFDGLQSWIWNLEQQTTFVQRLAGVVVGRGRSSPYTDIDSFDPPITVAKKVSGRKPQAFVDVAKILLQLSPSLYFVDPLFNPTKAGHRNVLVALLKIAFAAKCESVDIWVQDSKLAASQTTDAELISSIAELEQESGALAGSIRLHLVDDNQWDEEEFHDRYVFNEFGGIEFSRGFQLQSKMSVKVMHEDIHVDHIEAYPRGRIRTLGSITSKASLRH